MIKQVFTFKTLPPKKYTQLLIILIINFVLAPVFHGVIGRLFSSAILLYAIIIIVKTFSINRKLLRLYLGIASLAFTLEIFARFGWYDFEITFLKVSIHSVYALYLGVAVFLILQDIIRTKHITADTIRGSICAYLLIGFFWALLYVIVASFDERAFSQTASEADFYARAIHFSFTTITTLGYGDIVPISPFATMLTNLEAVIGQLYPSTLIAVLVGNYTSQKMK